MSGKPLEIIRDLSLSDQGYEDAWKALKEFYKNIRRLTNSHMHDLLTLKAMQRESSSALSKLMRDISVPQDALKSLKTASLDNLIVYLTASNFDEATQKDWQKSLGSSVEPPTFEQFQKFTSERIATLEILEQRIRPISSGTN